MKNKKLFWLPMVLLLALTVLTTGLLTACQWGGPPAKPTENQTETEPTQPEETQPEETQPEETQIEETQPEETEPEETENTGSGSSKPSVNTGTGGGYDPGASDPGTTEPGTDATEPAIEVPAAGSQNNAYYENIKNGAGKFTTVKIPAGGAVYYRIQTAGTFLGIEDPDVCVTFNEETYEARDGKLELELPGNDEAPICLSFTNKGKEDKNFAVSIAGSVGSQSNPIDTENLDGIEVSLEPEDLDGLFYRYVADKKGMLKLWTEGDSSVELNVLINAEPAQLTQNNGGHLCVQVKAKDEILIQILAKADGEGKLPAAQSVVRGYIAQMVEHSVMLVPFEAEPVTVPAGHSVYFTLSGVSDRYISIAAENACLYYGEQTLTPENGVLGLTCQENTVQIEVCNTGDGEAVYVLQINYPLGNILNPQVLTQLGDEILVNSTAAGGHYFSYTAPSTGILTFQLWTYPEDASAVPAILLSNKTTGETASLADPAEGTVSIPVMAADEVQIYAAVENIFGDTLDGQMGIMGSLYGTQENPIVVDCPGFTAEIPAGQTMYYQGYNMNGVIFALSGTDALVSHDGVEYSGEQISFSIVCQGREPGVFAITNPGAEDASYKVALTYPLGWIENPAPLNIGTNTLTREAGASDYYYTFTAQKDGKLTLHFDPSAQWTYTVNNLTQGVYGDIQWSDSEPVVAQPEFQLKKDDKIQIAVNTYDKDNMFENPAGTVVFTASFVTGPVEITDTGVYTTATLVAGEACEFTGNFQGLTLRVSGSTDATLEIGGSLYKADNTGTIKVEIPESSAQKLSFVLYNNAAGKVQFTILFSSQSVGSADNPQMLSVGSYSMVQSVTGGNDHYYKFVATTTGTLTFTFETDVDCIFIVNGNIYRYTHLGQNTYTIRVRPGAVINLVVNTYDPANPMVSPVGVVDFTVSLK